MLYLGFRHLLLAFESQRSSVRPSRAPTVANIAPWTVGHWFLFCDSRSTKHKHYDENDPCYGVILFAKDWLIVRDNETERSVPSTTILVRRPVKRSACEAIEATGVENRSARQRRLGIDATKGVHESTDVTLVIHLVVENCGLGARTHPSSIDIVRLSTCRRATKAAVWIGSALLVNEGDRFDGFGRRVAKYQERHEADQHPRAHGPRAIGERRR